MFKERTKKCAETYTGTVYTRGDAANRAHRLKWKCNLYKLKVRASGVYFPSIYDAEDTADKPDIEMVQWNVEM